MYMDDLNRIISDTVESIRYQMEMHGIEVPDTEQDILFEDILATLERVSGYPDYKNYN